MAVTRSLTGLYQKRLAARARGRMSDSECDGLPDARYIAPFRTVFRWWVSAFLSIMVPITIGIVAFDDCTGVAPVDGNPKRRRPS